MKRPLVFHLCLLALLFLSALCPFRALAASAMVAPDTVLLKEGDRGDAVIEMKQRLHELGFLGASANPTFSTKFTASTADSLKAFQEANGLEPTGVLTARDAQLLYSGDAQAYVAPTPSPSPTPEAVPTPRPFVQADLPETDEEGYLTRDEEYFYENDAEGQWSYLSQDLQIRINRYADESIPLIWFETEMVMRGDQRLLTTENNPDRPGTRFSYPYDIATQNQYVLGFTDDFYGHRIYRKETTGIVIRNGEVIGSKTYNKRLHNLPNLDMLAQYPDGRLETWYCSTITAEELLARGAINVFCFGPVVIKNGVIDEFVLEGYYDTKSPRQIIGMIAPNHYLLLTVQGRMSDSVGSGLKKPAEILLQRGVTEAFNLDGGNTMALVFRGRMLNNLAKWKDKKFVRTVTSLIGVGVSPQVVSALE